MLLWAFCGLSLLNMGSMQECRGFLLKDSGFRITGAQDMLFKLYVHSTHPMLMLGSGLHALARSQRGIEGEA